MNKFCFVPTVVMVFTVLLHIVSEANTQNRSTKSADDRTHLEQHSKQDDKNSDPGN